jgi:hypothetical protein
MYQFWLVLDNPALLNDVLEAWADIGVKGVTILESTGVHRVRSRASSQDAPFMLGFNRLLRTDQVGHNTLFAVVPDMDIVERLVAATEEIVGDLSQPNTGVLFAVPVEAAWGLPKQSFDLASPDIPGHDQDGGAESGQGDLDGPGSPHSAG